MTQAKPTDSEQPFINKLWDVFSVYSGFNDIPSPTLQFAEAQRLIQERDQQRLSAVLAEMPKKYEAPALQRPGISEIEYTKRAYYNLGIIKCEQALTAALGPDNSKSEE